VNGSDAVIVTFEHGGESYNVWVWTATPTGVVVNVRRGGSWLPIQLDGGHVKAVETQ